MANYTCDPSLEIMGHTAHAMLESINRDNYLPILEKYGLANISTDAWYPVLGLLSVFNDMSQSPAL